MKVDKIKILSTFFGIGYLPYFPGTWATLVGIGIYFLLRNNFIIYIFVSALIFTLGLLVCTKAETIFGKKDSHFIVIDEIAAILILLVLTHKLVQHNLFFIILAFFIFRILDIIKPYPIKKIENFSGSWGIMLDDIVACFYTIFFMKLINLFIWR